MTAGHQTNRDVRNARELSMRIHLGLNPIHDIFEALRVLHDEGREAFEKMRGPRCEYAHEWKPDRSEREATIEECAKVADQHERDAWGHTEEQSAASQIASAIRTLSKKEVK